MDPRCPVPRAAVEAVPPPLQAALRALAAPPSLVAVALLLANDHLFKRLWPGWLTGKLSDLAGLYFAPYLFLTALLALAWLARWTWGRLRGREPNLSAGLAGALAAATFALTGLFFAALKLPPTSPAAQRLLALALGRSVAVIADPTDLVALGVLPLSYLGWRRAGRARSTLHVSPAVRRAGQLLLLAVATLAVTASIDNFGSWPCEGIAALAADPHQGGVLYASRIRYGDCPSGIYPPPEPARMLFTSADNGTSWQPAGRGGERILPDPGQPGALYLVDYDSVWRRDGPDAEPQRIWPPDGEGSEGNAARFGLGLPAAVPAWKDAPIFLGVHDGVVRSDDAGATWNGLRLAGGGSQAVTALAATSRSGLLYAARGREILRSADSGATWQRAGDSGLPLDLLEVHPQRPDLLLGAYTGDTRFYGAALLRSEDGGATWQDVYHAGRIWALAFDPGGSTAYAAAGGMGILTSHDDGRSWQQELPYCLFDLDVRAVTVTSAGQAFFAGKFGGTASRHIPGIYRRRTSMRPWLPAWEPAQAGLGSAPALPLARFPQALVGLAGAAAAGVAAALAASPRLRGTLAANRWETALGAVGGASGVLVIAALVSAPAREAAWAMWVASLLGVPLLVLALKTRLTGATWMLSALPLVPLAQVQYVVARFQLQGLEPWLRGYQVLVLGITLGVSALQAACADFWSARKTLVAAIIAANAPLWLYELGAVGVVLVMKAVWG